MQNFQRVLSVSTLSNYLEERVTVKQVFLYVGIQKRTKEKEYNCRIIKPIHIARNG